MKGQTALIVLVVVIIAVIALVFLVPGILRPSVPTGVGAGTQGVIITSFMPELSTVESSSGSDTYSYTINLKNVGEMKATDVKAELVGGLGSGVANGVPTSLAGADPTKGLKGEEATGYWDVMIPESGDTDMTYQSTARVTYSYSTISDTVLKVATQEYVRTITLPGATPPKFGIVSSKTTGGPFTVTAVARAYTVPASSGTFRIQYDIQNNGGGRAYGNSITTDIDKVNIVVTAVGGTVQGDCATTKDYKLIQGKSKVLSCDVKVDNIQTYKEIPVKLTLTYNYFVDSTTSITVLKKIV